MKNTKNTKKTENTRISYIKIEKETKITQKWSMLIPRRKKDIISHNKNIYKNNI